MSRADELFSRYGSAGAVEVEGYDLSKVIRRQRTGPKLDQNLGSATILNQEIETVEEMAEADKAISDNLIDERNEGEIRLAFAFQSEGWAGTLMDRLNTFSYKDLFRQRISKVKSKTADINERLYGIKALKPDLENNE